MDAGMSVPRIAYYIVDAGEQFVYAWRYHTFALFNKYAMPKGLREVSPLNKTII